MATPEARAGSIANSHPLAVALSRFSELTGSAVAWLTLPMVVLTFLIALLRYVFAMNWIWLQELVIWMHAAVFMLAAAYTLNRDEHVRVDIFYRRFSRRGKAWIDLCGCIAFLLPVAGLLIWTSIDYVLTSWSIREGSQEVGGLPYPFVPALKTVIPAAFVLVGMQGIAIIFDAAAFLRHQRGAPPD